MNNVDVTNLDLDFKPEDNYNKINYHSWFPTIIGVVDCPFYKEIKEKFIEFFKINENTDKGFIYEPIHHWKEPFIFQKYTKWVEQQVNNYAELKVPKKLDFLSLLLIKNSAFKDFSEVRLSQYNLYLL